MAHEMGRPILATEKRSAYTSFERTATPASNMTPSASEIIRLHLDIPQCKGLTSIIHGTIRSVSEANVAGERSDGHDFLSTINLKAFLPLLRRSIVTSNVGSIDCLEGYDRTGTWTVVKYQSRGKGLNDALFTEQGLVGQLSRAKVLQEGSWQRLTEFVKLSAAAMMIPTTKRGLRAKGTPAAAMKIGIWG
jgi:hypothetical protein